MILDVPDDYQIPSTDPEEYWNDIKEKFGDQIEVDPFELDDVHWELSPESNFIIKEMGLDYFEWVSVFGDDGEEEFYLNLDHIPLDR